MRRTIRGLPLAGALLAAGCLPATPPPPRAAAPEPEREAALPPLAVEQAAGVTRTAPPPVRALDTTGDPGPPVTLSAANVDIRALLPVLAEAAGVSLVLGPDITGRVSVNLRGVPARTALEAVLAEAGLSLAGESSLQAPWGPTVFYAIPFDLDHASAAAIQRRFGVSTEVAEWIVANRK